MMLTKAQAAKAHFKGDKKSIDLLWLHGTQFVHKIVRKLESVNLLTIEKAEAEAVGYLAVGEALKTWKPSKSTFNTYIWIIVRGRILDSNRKEWNRGGVTSSHAPFFSDIDKLTEQDFGLLIDSGEHSYECLELYRKISTLNPNEKNVLVLRYFDGLTHKMIGNMLGFSRRYVISLEQAGIQSLKKKYSYN